MRVKQGAFACLVVLVSSSCGDVVNPSTDAGTDATVIDIDAMSTNNAPVAGDDGAETWRNAPVAIDAADLLANDTDADGDSLTVVAVLDAVNGTVDLAGTTIVFTPDVDYAGDASFDYQIADGNGGEDVGTVAVLVRPTLITTAPRVISGAAACTTQWSNTGRKVAVDADRNVYAAMICGLDVGVVASNDAGATYSLPTFMTFASVGEVAIQGGPPGVAYLAVADGAGVSFSRTIDGGVTWSPPTAIDTASSGVSLASSGDVILIGVRDAATGNVRVWRNTAQGAGAFSSADVTMSTAFFDVVIDELTGDVWAVGDTPDFHLSRSTDGGMTFAPELAPPPAGAAYYSDWSAGNGALYVSGSSPTSLTAIALDTMTPTNLTGLGLSGQPQGVCVSADAAGTVNLVFETDMGVVQLQRASQGAVMIDQTVDIDAGTLPSVVAHQDNGVVIVFTQGTEVFVAIQSF